MRRGFTLTELLAVIWCLVCLAAFAGVVWAAIHFIGKYW